MPGNSGVSWAPGPRRGPAGLLRLHGFVERRQTVANDHMACGASTTHVAGVLNVDLVVQQGFANRGTGGG